MINPCDIDVKELPLIVFVDNMQALISWGIKHHTKGNYNHVMIMHSERFVASQDFMFKEKPILSYVQSKFRLKFWRFNSKFPIANKMYILKEVEKQLKQPWHKKRYDFLGILGQELNIPFINNPKTKFCSERVADTLRKFIPELPKHPSPAELNNIFKTLPFMNVYGYWFCD